MANKIVCVTGGSGYLGSFLIKKLLEKGFTVHATLRNLGEEVKVRFLKSLPYADSRLVLFQADIYNPDEFAPAILGCHTVVHLATPLHHDHRSSLYKNTTEAALGGVKCIAESCIKSGTVKRLVYTSSVVAASPLKDDGSGFKDSMDETCWTPLNLSFPYTDNFKDAYVHSKTLSEKEVLRCNADGKLEVVSLACGLVGGDIIQPLLGDSLRVMISQFCKDKMRYGWLRFLEELIGKVPIVHIDDVASAFIFCIESDDQGLIGRFLCASDFVSTAEIASILQTSCCLDDGDAIPDEFIEDTQREIKWSSSKLEERGFQYKYNAEMILQGSVKCFKKSQQNVQ
ncbi:OLC1v1038408C1 [Oldenlandia corymbosa var. corymbosa]|uniref:OLC1v1038408C1 n=1 Tax=Oldenlandia corymbosa var. corymbosa TaxID=529605 RepID=A0AAV1CZN8_OLDCO|nr:OLC1v1038408C1 [Oldenlandia corymbosa var. corymbosa]